MYPDTPLILLIGFIGLPIGMIALAVPTIRRFGSDPADARRLGIAASIGLAAAAVLAFTGISQQFDGVPPPALPAVGVVILGSAVFGLSRVGGRLADMSLRILVGFQAFRILVELLIHQAAVDGIAPPQLSWSGRNLDIITGVLAVPVGLWADRLPKAALWAFNLVGLGLLLNVVIVAILSMPTPFQQITPDNTWVGFFPFIWLPTGLVTFALLGHVVLTRRLLRPAR